MFANIIDIEIVIAICAITVVAWLGIVNYSKFIAHKKKNKGINEDKYNEKYAFVPYFAIPCLFGAISVIAGLFVADYASVHGYIAGPEETCAIAVIASVIVNCIIDKYIVQHISDATYFITIEDRVSKSATESAKDMGKMNDVQKLELLRELLK